MALSFYHYVGLWFTGLVVLAALIWLTFWGYKLIDYCVREHWLPWAKKLCRPIPIERLTYGSLTIHKIGHTFTGGHLRRNVGFWIVFFEGTPTNENP